MRTPSSVETPASRSCVRISGDVSTKTCVDPVLDRARTRSEQRRLRFFGLLGSQAPQKPWPSEPPSRGTPPDDPQPRITNSSALLMDRLAEQIEEIAGRR